jgi:glycyl-tRNA synthetase beta chain
VKRKTAAKKLSRQSRQTPARPADLLFEIGVEELPSSYVPPALEQLERGARAGLQALRLTHGDVTTWGTPRRLTLVVRELAPRQADHREEIQGPAVRAAYDAEGQPTRALLGFCQGKGVDPSAVRRVQTPKGEYVAVTIDHQGRPAAAVLPAVLRDVATGLQFPKSMRWIVGDDTRFARPVRWLVTLLGDRVVSVDAFGVTSGRRSFGHRFLFGNQTVDVKSAGVYRTALERAKVIVDHEERRRKLEEQLEAAGRHAGGRVLDDDELVEINNFLVEWPTVYAGAFDRRYLDLPREVIVTALREHQRFFALVDGRGELQPAFLAVRNGDDRGLDRVRRGGQDVLAARLEDARFYWETDLQHPPAARVEDLAGVVWMEGLGSLRDKAERLESLAGWVAERIAPHANAAARRAALLCKTDLLSEMIGSGKEYARRAGEPEEVCVAIAEHYRPRGASDAIPESDAGTVLALADKLDHVAGAFVIGKVPSGSEDPYGVRRAGNGVVRILVERGSRLDLRDASMEMTRPFFTADPELPMAVIMKKLGEFWRGRVEAALDERGVPYDVREAALEAQVALDGSGKTRPGWIDAHDSLERGRVLVGFRADPRFESLVVLFRRVGNILKAATEPLPASLERERLVEPPERALLEALDRARDRTEPLWDRRAYAGILPVLLDMEHAIHAFFDGVMVNVEDIPTRVNRLRLLTEVRALFMRGWDLSRIVVEGEKS